MYTNQRTEKIAALINEGIPVTTATKQVFGDLYNESIGRQYRRKFADKDDISQLKKAKRRRHRKNKTYIITWAQNKTPVHRQFWENILAYKKKTKAELHVIAGRYKNPTSVFREIVDESWVSEVEPYLDARRQDITDYLSLLSDVKIQPTASMPLTGLEGLSSQNSCIIGHPRVHLKSLPVLKGYPPKLMVTTGAVTLPNYTDSKAGKKGEFHHSYGFTIVEVEADDIFHIRQVVADKDGNFYDYNKKVIDGVVSDNNECSAIVWGDLHHHSHKPEALEATIEMTNELNAKFVVLHDAFDGASVNHHAKRSAFHQQPIGLMDELRNLSEFLESQAFQFVVVKSNHDVWIDRWIEDADWRRDREKVEYLEMAMKTAKGECPNGILPYYLERELGDQVICLGENDSFRIHDYETGMHGHVGINGARGFPTSFKRLNTKNITGHTHAPVRIDGHLSVGTLTELYPPYARGASASLHSNIAIYPNGKAQHIHIIKGRYKM
jgi:hypothetical protein